MEMSGNKVTKVTVLYILHRLNTGYTGVQTNTNIAALYNSVRALPIPYFGKVRSSPAY
jgi:hypothetical protein